MKNPTVIALVTDNSFYADADGNYILANSPIGKTLLAETETYTTITAEGNYYSTGADSVSPFSNKRVIDITDLRTNYSSSGYIYHKYDVSTIQGYQNLTVDNFVVSTIGTINWSYAGNGTRDTNNSYDAETGIFTMGIGWSNGSNGSYRVEVNRTYIIC